jgi:uncharacterized membrane protein YfcA
MPRPVAAALLGAAAGFIGGLFGVGGGIVMVPGMVLALGMAQSRAHATSIASMIVAAGAAAVPLGVSGRIHWAAVLLLAGGAVVGAHIGARLIWRLSDVWLARAFLVLIVVAAFRMALSSGDAAEGAATAAAVDLGATAIGLIGIGLGAGILAALLGVGGGFIYVPALVALYAFPQHVAQATSLAVIVPTAAVAAATHARSGRVDWWMAAALGAGGVAGGIGGALLSLELGALVLRRMLAALLVVAGIRMLGRARGSTADGTP